MKYQPKGATVLSWGPSSEDGSALGLLSLGIHWLLNNPFGGAGNGRGVGMVCCAVSHGVVLQASALAGLAVVFKAV